MKKNNKGFTLIELLVVIAIIGILATIALVSLNGARSKARDAKRISDLRNLASALEIYGLDATATITGGTTYKINDTTNVTIPDISTANLKDPSTAATDDACASTSTALCEYSFNDDLTAGVYTYSICGWLENANANIGNTDPGLISITNGATWAATCGN
ncbi:MAG: type II secretion system protein [bacterium]|nr:type II secretion system protein [bacterium]